MSRTSPVDFSKLKKESHDFIEVLADLAFQGGASFQAEIGLPCTVIMHADNPTTPIAVFYLEVEMKDGDEGVGVTLMSYNEAEMFRPGRSDKLNVDVRPVRAACRVN